MRSAVKDEIVQLILDSQLKPGDPIPTEFELVRAFGVSRNSVREALKALQALEIVEIRHGHGTYVGRMSMRPLSAELQFRSMQSLRHGARDLRELLELRAVLEVGLIPRVLESITPEDFDALDAVVDSMTEHAEKGEWFGQEDREFHRILYRCIDNTLVQQLLAAFWDAVERIRDEVGEPARPPAETGHRHLAIVDALRKGDADTAARAVGRHFHDIDERIRQLTGHLAKGPAT